MTTVTDDTENEDNLDNPVSQTRIVDNIVVYTLFGQKSSRLNILENDSHGQNESFF